MSIQDELFCQWTFFGLFFSFVVLCGSLTSVGIIKLHCLEYPLVLVILSCYKNVIKETTYQQQDLLFITLKAEKSKIMVLVDLVSGKDSLLALLRQLLPVSTQGGTVKAALQSHLCEDTNPVSETSACKIYRLSKDNTSFCSHPGGQDLLTAPTPHHNCSLQPENRSFFPEEQSLRYRDVQEQGLARIWNRHICSINYSRGNLFPFL